MNKIFRLAGPVQNPYLTDPNNAAQPVGSVNIPQCALTMSGSTLIIENEHGFIDLQLSPQQVEQLKSELPSVQGGMPAPKV